jgi:YggT family protein
LLESILINAVRGARLLVAGAFVLSAIVALTHWGVRRGRIAAFGGWARFVRSWGDPLLNPVERRLVRAGANPQDAPLWLVGVVVVAGLALIALVQWLAEFIFAIVATARHGGLLFLLTHSVFELLKFAIMVRVLGSWLGIGRYNKWMRPAYVLTDWLVEPLRRVVPPIGMFDVSPLVAYFLLYFAEQLVVKGMF